MGRGFVPEKAGTCHNRRWSTRHLAGRLQRAEVGQETPRPLVIALKFSFASAIGAHPLFHTSVLVSKKHPSSWRGCKLRVPACLGQNKSICTARCMR